LILLQASEAAAAEKAATANKAPEEAEEKAQKKVDDADYQVCIYLLA